MSTPIPESIAHKVITDVQITPRYLVQRHRRILSPTLPPSARIRSHNRRQDPAVGCLPTQRAISTANDLRTITKAANHLRRDLPPRTRRSDCRRKTRQSCKSFRLTQKSQRKFATDLHSRTDILPLVCNNLNKRCGTTIRCSGSRRFKLNMLGRFGSQVRR